jgi:purine-binding chemotaxis protein CheW
VARSAVKVTVRVGAELYAMPVDAVLEVAEIGNLTPLPGAPGGTLGLQNHHGAALPVFDLARLLGISGSARPALMVVVDDGTHRAGLALDEVCDVGELPADEASNHPLLAGTVLTEAGLIGVVDVERLLDGLRTAQAA